MIETQNLAHASTAIIRAGQAESGAYVASPNFSQYGYSWLRDGAWIAHGMRLTGETESAARFHRWAASTLLRYQDRVENVLAKQARGEPVDDSELLPTRFHLDGSLGVEAWGDFQLDGYGAWLWVLAQHAEDDASLWQDARPAVVLLVRYLAAFWQSPNYDCWEEFRDKVHTATLAALYGGLSAIQQRDPALVPNDLPEAIRAFVLENCVSAQGTLVKFIGNDAVDSSLLWCATPFRLLEPDHPVFAATLARIERDLHVPGGGVYRFRNDTYFGGGEWPLLTAWLGWLYAETGRTEEACALLAWIEAQANAAGELPEQTAAHLLAPDYYPTWIAKWGEPAIPLLWSHGMYLILNHALNPTLEGRCS